MSFMSGHLQEPHSFTCAFTWSHQIHTNLFLSIAFCLYKRFYMPNIHFIWGPALVGSPSFCLLSFICTWEGVSGLQEWKDIEQYYCYQVHPSLVQSILVAVFPVRLDFFAQFSLVLRLGHFTEDVVGICVTDIISFPPFSRFMGAGMKGSAYEHM